jgi:hypothetical protein
MQGKIVFSPYFIEYHDYGNHKIEHRNPPPNVSSFKQTLSNQTHKNEYRSQTNASNYGLIFDENCRYSIPVPCPSIKTAPHNAKIHNKQI